MKPIEAGCKCRIINSWAGNEGIMVTIIKPVEAGKDNCDLSGNMGQRWEIDIFVKTNWGNPVNHLGEKQLERIDEYDGNDASSWDAIKDIWNPTKTKVPQH